MVGARGLVALPRAARRARVRWAEVLIRPGGVRGAFAALANAVAGQKREEGEARMLAPRRRRRRAHTAPQSRLAAPQAHRAHTRAAKENDA